MTAFACAKVLAKGKRHWYKAVEQTAFVALSDDSAWIIRTNGDLYLQTGNVPPVGDDVHGQDRDIQLGC